MAEENKSGSGDLMASGKVVAEATMSVFQQKSVEGVDKKEVAGAAADLLHSASTYGKLDDKPVGQYIDKAEGPQKASAPRSGGAAPHRRQPENPPSAEASGGGGPKKGPGAG